MSAETLIRTDELLEPRGAVAFHDVGWDGYQTLLKLRGERRRPRMVYLDGSVWLMSPSFVHEWRSERLGLFVMEVVVGLEIPCIQSGSTTFRRKAKRGGVEGDKTFYLTNEARIRGKEKIDLKIDPPPDLAIEAVHTHDAEPSVEVYRRLGVPEVWVCDGSYLTILSRTERGRYKSVTQSKAFPFLTANEILEWVGKGSDASDTDWVIALRSWVTETLKPRKSKEREES